MPNTKEEQAWFFNYITAALAECGDMGELGLLWTANAANVKAMPKDQRDIIILKKDQVKAKLKAS